MKTNWYKSPLVSTICTLCLLGPLCTPMSFEVKAAESSLDKEVEQLLNEDSDIELRIKVAKLEKELVDLKKENKRLKQGLSLQLDKDKEFERELAIQVLNDASSGEINQALIHELQRQLQAVQMIDLKLIKLSENVRNNYKALGAGRTERKQFAKDLNNVKLELKTDLLTSSEVNKKTDGQVMSRNANLKVVAVNLGLLDGITPGSKLSVIVGNDERALLRVVEVTRSISLAEIEKGQYKDVPLGTKVIRKDKTLKKNVGIWKQLQ